MQIREIEEQDNAAVATLVREVLTEFGANRPGFAWQDPELDVMSKAYSGKGRIYRVIEHDGRIVGCGGIAEFSCDLKSCCELQKMYLYPNARGRGWGRALIETLLDDARAMGYEHCYLESLASMESAMVLYQKQGFEFLDSPLGDSGHNACDKWMLLKL